MTSMSSLRCKGTSCKGTVTVFGADGYGVVLTHAPVAGSGASRLTAVAWTPTAGSCGAGRRATSRTAGTSTIWSCPATVRSVLRHLPYIVWGRGDRRKLLQAWLAPVMRQQAILCISCVAKAII